jgi:hypothetical protein
MFGFPMGPTPACTDADNTVSGCPALSASSTPSDVIITARQDTAGIAMPRSGQSQSSPKPSGAPRDAVRGTGGRAVLRDSYGVTRATPGASSPVALSDIASFRPAPGVDHMQPNGWAIVGLNTNFYAATAQQVVPGTLLGRDAAVRFTPVGFHWNYGDGSLADTDTAGGTWDALRLPEFDPTPSSHKYVARATYTITLSIDFSAEYRYNAGDWLPIDGVVSVQANPLTATASKVKTVLVAHDCLADPNGPGC